MEKLRTYLNQFHRLVWAEIDLDCVAHNIYEFQHIIPKSTQIMAVVKADAYGHGAKEVANAALQAGATRLAIAIIEEGIVLRQEGITVPIHILGVSAPGTEKAVIDHNLIPTICTIESARNFSDIGKALGKTIPFHLKLDTGMGRIGVRANQLSEFLEALKPLPNLQMEGIFSHFSKADEYDKTYTEKQLNTYTHCLNMVKEAGFKPRIRCLANSAGTMEVPESLFDMVRIGISLYGLYPSDEVDPTRVNLKPVMSWKTQIAHLKTLPPGEAVSYGGMFITQRPTVVATLPLGYADGYRRRLWKTGGNVLVKGQRVPIIGRVCMDMFMVDVTDIDSRSPGRLRESSGVAVGSEVILIGKQETETITADDMAKQLDTINYEITCLVGKRVPRVYLKEGKIIAVQSLLGYREI
jgi:alanine racemase